MKLIAAIVRTTSLERVVQSLEHIGIKSISISEIKGLGEEVRLNNLYSIHDKIEIIVSDKQVDAVVGAILENVRTGLPGDGIISVAPLHYVVKIRTKESME
jgi:nitrogen regulatory protein P-II 1